ncbi:hypothetical protein NOCA2610052 [metagenome]|uniref:Uncharacterized protein n=1 Tax=metagenome TaxID=256318 RepID=A0A2P2CEV4_9ZZZZ
MSHWGFVIEQLISIDQESVERERRRLKRRARRPAMPLTSYEVTCRRAAGVSRRRG